MGEAMYGKAKPGDLKHVALGMVGDHPALDRPAEMIPDRHGQIDQVRHGARSLLGVPIQSASHPTTRKESQAASGVQAGERTGCGNSVKAALR